MAVSDDGGPSNSLGTVERPVLYGGGQELRAVAGEWERGSRSMVAVCHDGGTRVSRGTGERLTLHGGGRPR
jgi:hypothetical protein